MGARLGPATRGYWPTRDGIFDFFNMNGLKQKY